MGLGGHDHYADAKWIVDQIEAAGFHAEAVGVRGAIDSGVSGNEIFMQLRYYLAPLRESERLDEPVQARLGILVDRIDEALSR